MSKAEDLALEKYPPRSVLVVPARGGGYYADSHLREGFIEGYHQAEKDLELGWEDAKEIYCIALNLRDHVGSSVFGQPFYEEVLKQFKDFKERKEKWQQMT